MQELEELSGEATKQTVEAPDIPRQETAPSRDNDTPNADDLAFVEPDAPIDPSLPEPEGFYSLVSFSSID